MKLNNSTGNAIITNINSKSNNNEKISLDAKVSSSVLQRLMQEVKNDAVNNISAYNRTHNRHNRGR